jgi:hypothetical protein
MTTRECIDRRLDTATCRFPSEQHGSLAVQILGATRMRFCELLKGRAGMLERVEVTGSESSTGRMNMEANLKPL